VIDDPKAAVAIVSATSALPPPAVLPAPRSAALDPARVYLASLQPSGRRSMAVRLRLVATLLGAPSIELMPWEELRFAHVAALIAHLAAPARPTDGSPPGLGLAPASVNATLAALRGVATAAWNLGLLDVEDLARLKAVKPVRGETLPAGRAVAAGELRALLNACAADLSSAGARDAALIAVLYACGLRRAELAALQVSDYAPATAERGTTLTVRAGKGHKARQLPVEAGAAAALEAWLVVRGPRPGALFVPINKRGRPWAWARGLSTQAVYAILAKRVAHAGLREGASPHDLRRSFISDLLDQGADIAIVQQLAGHATVTTTTRYDRRGERAKRKAIDLLHVPYTRRGEDHASETERTTP
jgi:site-specific recombinase XerD